MPHASLCGCRYTRCVWAQSLLLCDVGTELPTSAFVAVSGAAHWASVEGSRAIRYLHTARTKRKQQLHSAALKCWFCSKLLGDLKNKCSIYVQPTVLKCSCTPNVNTLIGHFNTEPVALFIHAGIQSASVAAMHCVIKCRCRSKRLKSQREILLLHPVLFRVQNIMLSEMCKCSVVSNKVAGECM